jgi:putative N6-adenine-specific DNA methylase
MDALVVCTPGLEAILDDELATLGIRNRRLAKGGVSIRVSTRELYAANVWLRTASRLLVRIGRFRATTFRDLEREVASLDWAPWLTDDPALKLRVSSGSSRLHHTGAIAERVRRVLGLDDFGDTDGDAADDPADDGDAATPQAFVVRVRHDEFTISVDASGRNLHQRGWRLATAKAPLRETLAAAMVLASGWRGERPLLDPMCGSGTIAIEAALLAQGRAPGAGRSFAFQRWPCFEPGTWASVTATVRSAEARAPDRSHASITAADRDRGAVAATVANAERAGVAHLLTVEHASLTESITAHVEGAAGDDPGLVLTNPPYGGRVGGHDLRDLYATLGRASHWDVGMLVANRALAGHTGLTFDERFRTSNGGIPVRYLQHPAGPARR